jgi:hypothetical protein
MDVERITLPHMTQTLSQRGSIGVLTTDLIGEAGIKGHAVKLAVCVLVY